MRAAALAAILVASTLLAMAPEVDSVVAVDSSVSVVAHFPLPLQRAAAVWTGNYAYIFGGLYYSTPSAQTNGPSDDIYRFDPVTNALTLLPVHLPEPLDGPSAVWDGRYAYIMGGTSPYGPAYLDNPFFPGPGPVDRIWRFDPQAGTFQLMSAKLPYPRMGMAAVWDGTSAWLFGGHDCCRNAHLGRELYLAGGGEVIAVREIFHYDPALDVAERIETHLPGPMHWGSAVWNGSAVILTGMANGGDLFTAGVLSDVMAFDPATRSLSRLADLQLPTAAAPAIWDGEKAVFYGGLNGSAPPWPRIQSVSGNAATMWPNAVPPRIYAPAIYSGCAMYIFGGARSDEVLRVGTPCILSANFSATLAPQPGCMAATYRFQDASFPADSAVAAAWDFGDFTTASGLDVSHTYTRQGTYLVTMTATDSQGNTSTSTMQVDIRFERPCPPEIFVPPTGYYLVGQDIQMCVAGFAGAGGSLAYEMEFGPPGAMFDATTGCFTWTPQQPGQWICVNFRVTEDVTSLSDEDCWRVVVGLPDGDDARGSAIDTDMDGVADSVDNCPAVPNLDQVDLDLDGIGDACDQMAAIPFETSPPQAAAIESLDHDGDGIPDPSDNCPSRANRDQIDFDGDLAGDACDPDMDGDGVLDASITAGAMAMDNCPGVPNPRQEDVDLDGQGDACDASSAPPPHIAARPPIQAPAAAGNGVVTGLGIMALTWVLCAVVFVVAARAWRHRLD